MPHRASDATATTGRTGSAPPGACRRGAGLGGRRVTGDVDGVIASRTLWLAPQIPIQFDYKGYETVQLRMDVLEVMFEAVEQGLCFIGDGPEPYELTDGDADE